MKKTAGLLLLVLLGVGVPFALGEVGTRLYFRVEPPPYPLNEWAYLAQRPPPYADADYFSLEMVRESMHSARRPDGSNATLGTFRGRHINVIDGVRATTDRPERYDHRVLVVGGSTVFSRRVPDSETIPSHLQRLIRARGGVSYAVTNLGSPGVPVKDQLERLRETGVEPGSVVVFYDGFNDAFNPMAVHSWYRRTLGGRKPSVVQKLSFVERMLFDLRLGVGANSALLRLLFDGRGSQSDGGASTDAPVLPADIESVGQIGRIYGRVGLGYAKTLVAAHRYVTKRGGSFYHFLQPSLYIQDVRSLHEQRVMEIERKLYPGYETAVRIAYPKLRQATESARAQGVASFDLTRAIEERTWEGEVYFDRAHVNHRANALLARHMFEAIVP